MKMARAMAAMKALASVSMVSSDRVAAVDCCLLWFAAGDEEAENGGRRACRAKSAGLARPARGKIWIHTIFR